MSINKKEILESMIKIRLVEQYIAKRYPEQQMKCPTHLCIGQEAIAAVFGYMAEKQDVFVGTYRSHGHYLAKGGTIKPMLAELLGKQQGCSKGFGGSMHLFDQEQNFFGTSAIVAGGVPIAAGAALSFKYRNESAVAVCFFGDAAIEEGVVYETVNFAVLHKLPIIFVCENNGLAISTPIELRQATLNLSDRFQSLGLSSKLVKENDMEGLLDAASEAYQFARSGKGPYLIECKVNRWSVHVGHNFEGPTDIWSEESGLTEADACPIQMLIKELVASKEISFEDVKAIKEQIQNEIEQAYEWAEGLADYSSVDLNSYVYASDLKSELPDSKQAKQDQDFNFQEQSKLVNPF